MTDETQEEVVKKYYFTVKIGLSEATVETEFTSPSISVVIAEAMGVDTKLVNIDEVWVDPDAYWRAKIIVAFHVGSVGAGQLRASLYWTRM